MTILLGQSVAFAGREFNPAIDRIDKSRTYKPEIFDSIGVIHSLLDNDIELEFVRSNDKEKFDIVDSQELEKLNWTNHKSRLVSVQAVKTPKFLFWGGNLKVKSFKIIKEVNRYKMPNKIVNNTPKVFREMR